LLSQAYTSQYVALIMMALLMSEDRISLTDRRNEIIAGLHALPHNIAKVLANDSKLQDMAKDTLKVSQGSGHLSGARDPVGVEMFCRLLA